MSTLFSHRGDPCILPGSHAARLWAQPFLPPDVPLSSLLFLSPQYPSWSPQPVWFLHLPRAWVPTVPSGWNVLQIICILAGLAFSFSLKSPSWLWGPLISWCWCSACLPRSPRCWLYLIIQLPAHIPPSQKGFLQPHTHPVSLPQGTGAWSEFISFPCLWCWLFFKLAFLAGKRHESKSSCLPITNIPLVSRTKRWGC